MARQSFRIDRLRKENIRDIIDVERKAFIPPIQASNEIIISRLEKQHVYLGAYVGNEIAGTLAFRYVRFELDFNSFVKKYPSFESYANSQNEANANSVIVYNLGVIPKYRGGRNAVSLIHHAIQMAKKESLAYILGDGRIPSYNGSHDYPEHENVEYNPKIKEAIDKAVEMGTLPDRNVLSKDPITGFYLLSFPQLRILGITDQNFCREDYPTGGRKAIIYVDLTDLEI